MTSPAPVPHHQLPLAILILTRMEELGLDRQSLGFRLGY